MVSAQSTTRDYIRAERQLESISKLFIPQVIILLVLFFFSRKPRSNSILNFGTQNRTNYNTCFGAYYIPRALNTGFCIQKNDLLYSAGLHRNRCLPQLTQEKLRGGFGKNAGELTGILEISKKEIPVSKRNMQAIHWPTPGFKGRTFKLCVLTRWDFNFRTIPTTIIMIWEIFRAPTLRKAQSVLPQSRDNLLVRAPDSWSKGCELESRQERRENFLLQS